MKFLLSFCMMLLSFQQMQSQNLDLRILDKINGAPSTVADRNWNHFTDTDLPVTIATPVTLFIVGAATKNHDLKIKSYQTGIAIFTTEVITSCLKIGVRRERPFTDHPDIIYRKAKGNGFSFPSGHTSTAFATATSLSLSFPKWYVIVPSYTYACAIA
ncbi:MAG: phosphatase PAP2 family protein, partial [Bacteroidota bacterium]